MKRPFLTMFFFVGLGAILLGLNLGLFDLETSWKELIFPGIFIIMGASSLDAYAKKHRDAMALLWGLFWFTFGTLITLGILDLLEFTYRDWLKLWPILIVAFGLHQLFNNTKKKEKETVFLGNSKKVEKPSSFHSPDWTVEPIHLEKKVADYYFDFSKAIIPLGETEIKLTGYVGDIHMLIPEHLAIHITVKGNVGDVEVFDRKENGIHTNLVHRSPNYESSEKRLRIFISFNVVDVKIQGV